MQLNAGQPGGLSTVTDSDLQNFDGLTQHDIRINCLRSFPMYKKLLAFFAAMTVVVAFAAVDVNKATSAELDGIKGIGPAMSGRILDERKKGGFKNWEDLIGRVKGIGEVSAAKFSAEGLTVGGAGYKGAATAPAKKDDKMAKPAAAAKTDVKVDAKPSVAPAAVATAPPAKADAKANAANPAASAAKK
jgi:competence protein ComEA